MSKRLEHSFSSSNPHVLDKKNSHMFHLEENIKLNCQRKLPTTTEMTPVITFVCLYLTTIIMASPFQNLPIHKEQDSSELQQQILDRCHLHHQHLLFLHCLPSLLHYSILNKNIKNSSAFPFLAFTYTSFFLLMIMQRCFSIIFPYFLT